MLFLHDQFSIYIVHIFFFFQKRLNNIYIEVRYQK